MIRENPTAARSASQNSAHGPQPRYDSIAQAFAAQAQSHPERIAIDCGARQLRYRELSDAASALAGRLVARGIGAGAVVGICAPRGPEAVTAMLAILQAGATYLPLDPAYPEKLLRHIVQDAEPGLVLVHGDSSACAQPASWKCPTLPIADPGAGFEVRAAAPLPQTGRDDPAYLMYTSGSTGTPKGVLIPQRGVLRLVLDADYVKLDEDEVLLQLAPLSFDASTLEIWGALLNGGRLAMLQDAQPSLERIAEVIAERGVTTLWLTAGLFHLMIEHQLEGLRPLRQLLAGGDVLSPAHVERARQALPQCRLINGYGPTENTTFSCCYTVPAGTPVSGAIPIGRAIRGTEIQVLDDAGRPVADGDTGELYVGGDGLALGYHRRPELTGERFIAHPQRAGEKLYRTGDRVRVRADGQLEFLGRDDRQVKIGGKRVELDGIEACLRRHPQVAEAAVSVSGDDTTQRRIVAYVSPASRRELSVEELRRYLRAELPDYMHPAVLQLLPELPLTANGKVDRAALAARRAPPPTLMPARQVGRAAARGSTEAILLDLWQEVIGTPLRNPDENFFEAGATSLQLVKLHAAIQAALKPDLRLMDLFSHPRLSALAAHIGVTTPPPGNRPAMELRA